MPATKTIPERATQERAIQTRKDLLDAARRIFARDGFEVARLHDIAEDAGKTRGALYAHFADKEDLFFALIEDDIRRDGAFFEKSLRPDSSLEERIQAMSTHMEALVFDRQRILLYLEFKMYAIRHPHNPKRLADLHAALCAKGLAKKGKLLPELLVSGEKRRRAVYAAFASVLDGLALNFYFDPAGLTRSEVRLRTERLVRERMT